ncbi:hypothetical protein FIBSPDRAFT_115395 [Athelia psychrophila]|uniref:Uncharacterized protein n=1 Tax=Athelia psychrophila TaxID=1759441 RepID=A0A166D3E9_9AGAM|nr:hypothetical protein FIBSPDRAFT_115395 [Fibularhizoctonia sp. CBS 109695]
MLPTQELVDQGNGPQQVTFALFLHVQASLPVNNFISTTMRAYLFHSPISAHPPFASFLLYATLSYTPSMVSRKTSSTQYPSDSHPPNQALTLLVGRVVWEMCREQVGKRNMMHREESRSGLNCICCIGDQVELELGDDGLVYVAGSMLRSGG